MAKWQDEAVWIDKPTTQPSGWRGNAIWFPPEPFSEITADESPIEAAARAKQTFDLAQAEDISLETADTQTSAERDTQAANEYIAKRAKEEWTYKQPFQTYRAMAKLSLQHNKAFHTAVREYKAATTRLKIDDAEIPGFKLAWRAESIKASLAEGVTANEVARQFTEASPAMIASISNELEVERQIYDIEEAYRSRMAIEQYAHGVGKKAAETPVVGNLTAAWLESVFGLTSLAARALGREDIARAQAAGEVEKAAAEVRPGLRAKTVRGAARSLLTIVPAAYLGGPWAAISVAAIQQTNESYNDARDANLPHGKAIRYAATAGTIEAGTTAAFQLVGAGGIESVFQKSVGTGVKGALKIIGITLAAEIPEEVAVEIGHSINEAMSDVNPYALTKAQLTERIRDTVLQTILAVGVADAAHISSGMGLTEQISPMEATARAMTLAAPQLNMNEAEMLSVLREASETSVESGIPIDEAVNNILTERFPETKEVTEEVASAEAPAEVPTEVAEEVTPIVEPTEAPPIPDTHRALMAGALEASKEVVPVVKREIRKGRRAVAGAIKPKVRSMQKHGVPTEDAVLRSIPPGPLTEYTERFPSIRNKLPKEVLESYFASIPASPRLRPFEVINTSAALTKLIDGSYLTITEAHSLKEHFKGIAPEIADMVESRILMGDKAWQIVRQAIHLPMTTLTGVADVSGIARQGLFLMGYSPTLAPQYVDNYISSFFSEEATQRLIDEVHNSPNHARAVEVGKLQLTELPELYTPIGVVEETQIGVPLLERVPVVGPLLIRPTARSFASAINWYRMTIVDRAISMADRAGQPLTDAELKRLCGNINDMSGRASISRGAQETMVFLKAMFAARFTVSRVKMVFRPMAEATQMVTDIAKGRKIRRPHAIQAWSMVAGFTGLVGMLLKTLWPDEVEIELDPRAADFGKIRIGDVRFDLLAGTAQVIRTATRLLTGRTKTAAGKIVDTDYKREVFNAFRGRANPAYSFAVDLITGENFIGEAFGAPPRGKAGEKLKDMNVPKWVQGAGKEFWNRTAPLHLQDFADALVEEGLVMGAIAGAASTVGIGVVAYPERAATKLSKFRDEIAQKEYNKPWDELAPSQQVDLSFDYEEQLQEIQVEADRERSERQSRAFVAKMLEGEIKYGKPVVKQLSEEAKDALDEVGFTLSLSRTINLGGDRTYRMSDETLGRYQNIVFQELRDELPYLLDETWVDLDIREKKLSLAMTIQAAKERARDAIMEELELLVE